MRIINWAVDQGEITGFVADIHLEKDKGMAEIGTIKEELVDGGLATYAKVIVFYSEKDWKLFQQLVNRAMNCWDRAPATVKEFGDMVTEGKIQQNYQDLGSEVKPA